MKLTLCLLMAILSASVAWSTDDTSQSVDEYIRAEMRREHMPGLALGVYRNGHIVKVQGYGFANLELNVPVKPETIFQSGSVGKQFTATAVMMMVEQNKIRLEDSILKYLPDGPPQWAPVEIRNLLSHTSGIAEYTSEERSRRGGAFDLRQDNTEDELYAKIKQLPMDFKPGEKWVYTNTNYVLLGIILHRVTGQFYGDFLHDHIFQPLGMNSTRIISEADIIPNRASGYELRKGEIKNQEWVSPTYNTTADGALYFNVLDLAKWDEALSGEKLLKRSSLDAMWKVFPLNNGKPNPDNYGFAWGINEVRGHRLIEHGGSWQGFATHIARYADDHLTVVVLTNLDSAHSRPARIAHRVAALYQPELTPAKLPALEDANPTATSALRSVLVAMASGSADRNAFTAEAQDQLFGVKIKEMGEEMKLLGDLRGLELIAKPGEEERSFTYRAVFAKGNELLSVRMSKEGKIAGLEAWPEWSN